MTALSEEYNRAYADEESKYEAIPWESTEDRKRRISKNLEHMEPSRRLTAARRVHEVAVEASVVALAHATLEDHIAQAVELSMRLAFNRWIGFFGNRSITLREINDRGVDCALYERVPSMLAEIEAMSLPKRIDRLLKVSSTDDCPIAPQHINMDFIYRFDQRRNELIHEPGKLSRDFMPINSIVWETWNFSRSLFHFAALGHAQAWSDPHILDMTSGAHARFGHGVI